MRRRLLAKLHIMLKEQGVEDCKVEMYAPYGVTSSRDLTDGQLLDLVNKLEGAQPKYTHRGVQPADGAIRKLRSEVLSLLTKSPRSTNQRKRGLGIPNDWSVLNPFIERHGGMPLSAMGGEQLVKFKKQLLAMRQSGWSYRLETEPAQKATTPIKSFTAQRHFITINPSTPMS